MKQLYLAGGCFWGVEAYFSMISGVVKTTVGYANGHVKDPTYNRVCSGDTGHTETIEVQYDEQVVSLEALLEAYFKVIDPTVLNRQGPDVGTQYRTGIYFVDASDQSVIEAYFKQEQSRWESPIVTELGPLVCFYPAEDYHQKYLKKNPGGYCHIPLN